MTLATIHSHSSELVAYSPRKRKVLALAARVAGLDATVLITGESGVGKERLAQYIHDHSGRARRSFVGINCGALPETLLENELFGHRRGAFTGAIGDSPGLFEVADRGTIFLDELGDMPLGMQVKLLRVLQEREIRRLGDTRTRRIDVRVIAATNRDLQVEMRAARFRADLFFRVNVVSLHVPALRECPEDLRALADSLLAATAARMGRRVGGFTEQALERLLAYDWPGNIRELQNAIERACAVATGERIDTDDLPDHVCQSPAPAPAAGRTVRPLWEVEREHILDALRRNSGNRTLAAQALRIGTKTLYRKLKSYERVASGIARGY